jgi:pyrroloquinoline quinone (PQQ) biosynthesis protein C
MTKEEIQARIDVLCDEMDANEEENRTMQSEVDQLYKMLDKMYELENEDA